MGAVVAEVSSGVPDYFTMFPPPARPHRRSAVLMLFGPRADGGSGDDIVLTERSRELRAHPGQVSFPGGALDEEDGGPVQAALREANEEVGIRPESVEVVDALPELYLSPSRNAVTPVLAWWLDPAPLTPQEAEVARVVRASVADLVDPENRFTVVHPSGVLGPGFEVEGLFVWGFTAMLLSALLDLAGLSREWDAGRRRPIPDDVITSWTREGRP
jgi:8-oxo-dGTP pyrophosphatase MutT (NUDIX family)